MVMEKRSPKVAATICDMAKLEDGGPSPRLSGGSISVVGRSKGGSLQTKFFILILFLATGISLLAVLFTSLPKLDNENYTPHIPRNFDDLRETHRILKIYTEQYYGHVLVGLGASYMLLSLQAFAIPGSTLLNLLSGALFGVKVGFVLVNTVATMGACICYVMSSIVGRGIIGRYFPGLLAKFQAKVESHRDNLFSFLLFLRISPLLPNWFINTASPILNIPFSQFFWATFFGLMPANFIGVKAGLDISNINSTSEVVPVSTLLSLLGLGLLALVPGLLKNKLEAYLK